MYFIELYSFSPDSTSYRSENYDLRKVLLHVTDQERLGTPVPESPPKKKRKKDATLNNNNNNNPIN